MATKECKNSWAGPVTGIADKEWTSCYRVLSAVKKTTLKGDSART